MTKVRERELGLWVYRQDVADFISHAAGIEFLGYYIRADHLDGKLQLVLEWKDPRTPTVAEVEKVRYFILGFVAGMNENIARK